MLVEAVLRIHQNGEFDEVDFEEVRIIGEVIDDGDELKVLSAATKPGEVYSWSMLTARQRESAEERLRDEYCDATLRSELLVTLRDLVRKVEEARGPFEALKHRPTTVLLEELRRFKRTGDYP